MATDLGRLVATLEARAERFDLTLQRANANLDKLARQTEQANERMARSSARLSSVLGAGGRAFRAFATTGAAAATAIAVFAGKQFAALDALGDLSQQTGLAASELRLYQAALSQSGGSAELASEGILTFTRNLGQAEAGTGRFAAFLTKLDPAFLENVKNAGSTSEALALVADRIGGARDEQEKLAIATAAFGPAGRQFVLLMENGAAGVDELKRQLAALGIAEGFDELVPKVQRFDDALKQIQDVVTNRFVAGFFGVGEGLGAIDERVSDPQFQQNLGTIAHGIGELGAKAVEASVGLAELFTGLRTFDTLDLERKLAGARTALQDFDQDLARRGIDPGRGLEGGETLQLGAAAFGPPQAGAASPQHAEAIRLLRERARLVEVVTALERDLAAVKPHPLPARTAASGSPAGDPAPDSALTRAIAQAAARDRELTAAHSKALAFLRELEAADKAHLAEQQRAAEQITRAWEEATLDQVSLLERRREAALRNVEALFQGSAAQLEELQLKVNETFDAQVDAIVTPVEAKLLEISQFGEQVFGDMVEGWVQGADVSFEGIARSFAALIIKMQAEALAADIFGSLSGGGGGGGGGSGSWWRALLGGLIGSIAGGTTTGGVSFDGGGILTGSGAVAATLHPPEAVIPLPDGLRSLASGPGALTVKLEQTVAPGIAASPLRVARGPSGEVILQQLVTQAMTRDARTNGPIAQTLQPNGPASGLR
jgi:hypothetical protein